MLYQARAHSMQVIPMCFAVHSRPSLRPLVKYGGLTGVVRVLGEFCVACGANAWLGNGKARHEPPDRRPTRGLRGLAGLRADAPSEARGAGGERAGRSRGGRRSGGAVAGRRSGGAAAVVAGLAGLWQAAGLVGLRSTLENKGGVAPRIRKTGDL